MEPIEHGEVKLLVNVLVQAVKDALTGKKDALDFLSETGAELAEYLRIANAETVRNWVQEPTAPPTLTISQVAEYVGCNVQTVYKYARNGELPAYPSITDKSTWCILQKDADLWAWSMKYEHRLV